MQPLAVQAGLHPARALVQPQRGPWAPQQRPRRRSSVQAAAQGGRRQPGDRAAPPAATAAGAATTPLATSAAAHSGCETSHRPGEGHTHDSSSSSNGNGSHQRPSGSPHAASLPPAGQRGTQPADGSQGALGVPPAEQLPRHLAVIMDGNSRWAAARGLPAAEGHRRGVDALRTLVKCCRNWGVPPGGCLTVYAFSWENWRRAPAEVDALLSLMESVLAAEAAELAAQGVRLRFIGELGLLPASLRRQIASAELATADNCDLHLTVALSYAGRQDLTLAVQELARLAAAGQLRPADITPEVIEGQLATRQLPPAWRHPDLLVRTSGEKRLSNFLTWETAYSELHFSPVLWPDFGESDLAEALRDYAARERRFGGRRAGREGAASSRARKAERQPAD